MEYLCVGGSHGIGRHTVELLSSDGHTVHVASREEGELAGLPYVTHHVYDAVTGEGTLPELEMLNGFLYLPGSIPLKPFSSFTQADFVEHFTLNLAAAVPVLQRYLKALKQGKGSVAFLSSVAAGVGLPFHTAIAAAKASIEGFVRAFAAEHAPDIRCNCVAPSLTDTPLGNPLLNSTQKQENAAKRHPLARCGKTEDIARALVFLLTHQSSWVTGQVLHVDGGLSSLRL